MWVVHSENIQMAKFVLLLALLCVQFSRGEEGTVSLQPVRDEQLIPLPAGVGVQLEVANGEKLTEEEWTGEDDKWVEEIEELLAEDSEESEDYDVNYVEFGKVVREIEKLMNDHYPDKAGYKWLQEIAKWFDAAADDYEDELEDEADEALVDFYHWMYQTNVKNNERVLQKRFSSV